VGGIKIKAPKIRVPTVKQIFKDPVKSLAQVLPYAIAIGPGGLVASNVVKKFTDQATAKLPDVPYFAEPRQAQEALVKGQLGAAEKFSAGLGDRLRGEMESERLGLADEVGEAQRQARAGASARGMLYSGQRMKAEGDIANEAANRLAQARSQAIQRAMGQEQAMFAQPLQSRANIAETAMNQQGLLDRYKQETESQRARLLQAGMASVGTGLGEGLGNLASGKRFRG